jgi:putative hydrolase of the HAD superfamily
MKNIKVIGFDADDTLWANAVYFQEAEKQFQDLMQNYQSREELTASLYETESANMEWYGYGVMAFTLSMIETAVRVSRGQLTASSVSEILKLGKSILAKPIELFPGVPDILPELQKRFRLVVVTKGDLLDQERKLKKSGLEPFFQHVEVMSEKHESNYANLIRFMNIEPHQFLMVGNSLKSDIYPVLAIGGQAVHAPFEGIWQHERVSEFPNRAYFEISSLLQLPAVLSI